MLAVSLFLATNCAKKKFSENPATFEKRVRGMSSAKQEGSRSTRIGGHRDVYNACRESNQSGSPMPYSAGRSRNASALSGRGCLGESHVTRNVRNMVEQNDSAVEADSDLEYGPGIVDKLKSRFIHLTLKESQKRRTPLRRFSSLENVVQEDPFQAIGFTKGDGAIVRRNRAKYGLSACGKTMKSQSMETLVLKSDERNRGSRRTVNKSAFANENIVIVENKRDNGEKQEMTNSTTPYEELPRPDTVKTYKRMFEPAESKSLYRRRPPVLRASAKSSTNKTNNLVKSSAIVNGDEINGPADNFRYKDSKLSADGKKEVRDSLCQKPPPAAKRSPGIKDAANNKVSENPPSADRGFLDSKEATKNASQSVLRPAAAQGSLVFDFRGKSTKPNVSLQPTPFGCKPVQKSVRKTLRLFDGKEGLPPGCAWEEDEDEVDEGTYLPQPSGVRFVGENVILEKNCLLSTRNKKLTIQFNDKATSVHEYPSETSLLENSIFCSQGENDSSSLSFSGGLANYTPKGLETVKPFQLGLAKPPSHVEVPEVTDTKEKENEELTPADPGSTFSWSSSTTTSDLLF